MLMAQQAIIRGILSDASYYYVIIFILSIAAPVIPTGAATQSNLRFMNSDCKVIPFN
jgi:hypothetical protein